MRNIILFLSLTLALLTVFLGGCVKENDFYQVGRQPVELLHPMNDTIWALNYQSPDSLYTFSWQCKRDYIDFNLHFSLHPDMSEPISVPAGIQKARSLTTMQVDSILSAFNIGIGQSAVLYWTIDVTKEEDGWCEQINKLNITRCDLPTNVILLKSPDNASEMQLDKTTPDAEIPFAWDCQTEVKDYKLSLSFDEAFTEPIEFECGNSKSRAFTHQYMDSLLQDDHAYFGESRVIYWKVTGTGNLNNPIENSATRAVTFLRYLRDPMPVTLTEPADKSDWVLDINKVTDQIEFAWTCDTTGVNYTLQLFDTDFGHKYEIDCGSTKGYATTQADFDQLLAQQFEMVPSQKKMIYWKVLVDDTLRAVPSDTYQFTATRFAAVSSAPKIELSGYPADGASYTLNASETGEELFSASWRCTATNVTYAVECSLNNDMTKSITKSLETTANSYSFTQGFVDGLLAELGAAYQTKTVYWRITSTVSLLTTPSDTHSLKLTGMIKPFTDDRDKTHPETYGVVKVGNAIWMAENLRATKYADGTSFETVDLPSKTTTTGVVSDPGVIGQYYTWPTAVRDMNKCRVGDNTTQVQGVCPNGWHVSTMKDWENMADALSNGDFNALAGKIKSTDYWHTKDGITNSSGLSLLPGGKFWHGKVADADFNKDGTDEYGSYWTTTPYDNTNAYIYEVFDQHNPMVAPWYYLSGLWENGDTTASKMANIRCVRDY